MKRDQIETKTTMMLLMRKRGKRMQTLMMSLMRMRKVKMKTMKDKRMLMRIQTTTTKKGSDQKSLTTKKTQEKRKSEVIHGLKKPVETAGSSRESRMELGESEIRTPLKKKKKKKKKMTAMMVKTTMMTIMPTISDGQATT